MQTATSVDVRSIRIHSKSGRSFDAALIFDEIVLNESFSMPTMNGRITINDDNDHFETLPIIGQEVLEIDFKAFDEQIFTFTFWVYKVSEIRKTNEFTSQYDLFFVSPEQMANENKRLSRSFSNMKYSSMITDVLQNEIGTSKELAIDETLNRATYVAPNIRPFKAINYMCKHSISALNQQSNYVFYEDRRGFIAVPLQTLANRDSKYTYRYYAYERNQDTDKVSNPFTIFNLSVKKQTDVLETLSQGMFASTLTSVDLIRQNVESQTYDYWSEFQKSDHMNRHPLFIETDAFETEGNQYFTYTNESVLENSYVSGHDSSIIPDQSSFYRLRRRIQTQSFNNHVLNISIPGNALLFVGDVIDIEIPSPSNKTDENTHRTISGKNLVSAITHVFTGARAYMQRVETIKDSLIVAPTEGV